MGNVLQTKSEYHSNYNMYRHCTSVIKLNYYSVQSNLITSLRPLI